MGVLRSKRDGSRIHLPTQLIVGRASASDLVLPVPSVSASHALVRWSAPHWTLVDLGSRNGTYLNGKRLGSTTRHQSIIAQGDEVAFAEREEAWTLVDEGPPRASLVPEDGSEPIGLSDAEIRPWSADGVCHGYVYCEAGTWKLEDLAGCIRELRSGDVLHLHGVAFRLQLPAPSPETPCAMEPVAERTLATVSLDICVSADEEAATVTAQTCGDRLTLPARSHLYLLAYLARRRLSCTSTNLGNSNEGWAAVDETCHDLAIPTAEALAVTVYRCRKDFERLGFREASRLVDRDKRGLLRIGIPADRLRVRRD
jgi:FHA domain